MIAPRLYLSSAGLVPQSERAALIAIICAMHIGGLVAFGFSSAPVQVLAPLDVDLVAKGDYFVDTIAAAGPPAEQISPTPPTPDPQVEPEPKDPPPVAAPPPEPPPQAAVEAPDPTPSVDDQAELAAQRAKAEKLREQKREEKRREEKRREEREKRQELLRERERAARSRPQGGSEAHRAGVANGEALAGARANYGAIVAAELNRHKFYPPGARAAGETGSVGVTFVIGASGRVVSHAITRSSGSSALDGAVNRMMATAHAPPPPGGSFRGSININFNLGR